MFADNALKPPLIILLGVKYCTVKNVTSGTIIINAVKSINFCITDLEKVIGC